MMNKDVFEGKWKQEGRGQVRERWGTPHVTDDDLDRVARKHDKLIGVLQEKHGYTRERAEKELNRRLAKHGARLQRGKEMLKEQEQQERSPSVVEAGKTAVQGSPD
jgi:uncharacterized protein YjbJ (UPF0337 family)